MGDLSERAAARRLHQLREHVAALGGRLLQTLQHGPGFRRVPLLERAHARDLAAFFLLGRAGELGRDRRRWRLLVEEGVDPDDWQRAVVLLALVVERLVLNLAALIA